MKVRRYEIWSLGLFLLHGKSTNISRPARMETLILPLCPIRARRKSSRTAPQLPRKPAPSTISTSNSTAAASTVAVPVVLAPPCHCAPSSPPQNTDANTPASPKSSPPDHRSATHPTDLDPLPKACPRVQHFHSGPTWESWTCSQAAR